MFPSHSDMVREHKGQAAAIMREITGEAAHLDLGKKVSIPQDLMMEELSLQRNRGSCMYLERQKRVQRFTFEYPSNHINALSNVNASHSGQTAAGNTSGTEAINGVHGKESFRSEVHIGPGGNRTPPNIPKKSAKVLQMKMSLNPGAIAPGYAGPLKSVPYEKFNSTAIPKSYRSPWVDEQYIEPVTSAIESLPEPPQTPLNVTYHCYNRAPTPFGSLSFIGRTPAPTIFDELQAQIEEASSGLELMCQRPSFNRAPRGWTMKFVPESVDL